MDAPAASRTVPGGLALCPVCPCPLPHAAGLLQSRASRWWLLRWALLGPGVGSICLCRDLWARGAESPEECLPESLLSGGLTCPALRGPALCGAPRGHRLGVPRHPHSPGPGPRLGMGGACRGGFSNSGSLSPHTLGHPAFLGAAKFPLGLGGQLGTPPRGLQEPGALSTRRGLRPCAGGGHPGPAEYPPTPPLQPLLRAPGLGLPWSPPGLSWDAKITPVMWTQPLLTGEPALCSPKQQSRVLGATPLRQDRLLGLLCRTFPWPLCSPITQRPLACARDHGPRSQQSGGRCRQRCRGP